MKRILFLTLTAVLFTSCERPTGLATRDAPVADLTAATSTTFSGDATVLRAAVLGFAPIVVGEAGPVSESGGAEESSVLSVSKDETGGLLSAEVVHASVVAQGKHSRAEASVASANLTVAGNAIQADLLRSQAEATCSGGQASASGSSEVAGLVINGTAIAVSGNPNQTVDVPGLLRVVINEQSGSASGNRSDITVNALHVTAFDPLSGQTLADVIISSAHADISCAAACPPPAGDFVTGGGWITGTPSGARATFGVAGGNKNGGLWGHLTYIDHGTGMKVKGTGVTDYVATGPTSRHISGTAEINGVSGSYTVDVTDAGEPGRDDTFSITLSNGYSASGTLGGGNIQLHAPDACP